MNYRSYHFQKLSGLERFWLYIDKKTDNECWPWKGGVNKDGYSSMRVNNVWWSGHRFAYHHLVKPIPEGLTIDHLCKNRRCCNPKHLEPVTASENIIRGDSSSSRNRQKTHCKNGHAFSKENTYVEKGKWRRCRTCQLKASKKYYYKEKTHSR